MKKRVIATLMAGVLSAGMLTGCGNGGSEASGAASASQTAAEKSQSQESEASAAEDNGETVTVKWCVPGDRVEDHDLVMEDLNKKLKEKINVELDLEMIPQGEFNDKMKLASTAGEDFDLVFTANWLNSFEQNMSRDAFLPLDDLIAQYGKELGEAVPEWLMDVAKVDGKVYAVPNQQIIARQLGVVIQKEYAEKYGFDKTSLSDITELYPFLDQIVENEPEMFVVDYRVGARWEDVYENVVGEYVFIDKNDPEAALVPATTAMEEELRMNNEWYKKGYIRKDIATVTDNSADVKANRYVCTLGAYKPGWDAEFTQRQGVEYIAVPIEGAYVKANSGSETMTAINVNSKNPEAAMKLLNLVYTDKEIFNELLFGMEGVHYNMADAAHAEAVADSKYNYSAYAWKFGNQFNAYYVPGQADGLWEATDKLNNEAQVSVLRGFVFNPENVQSEMAQLDAVNKEFLRGQYTAEDIDKYIADRNAKLEQAGLNTVMEEVQKQIDEWKAASAQ